MLTFTVTVYNKGKRSKDTEVAELTVELSNLTNGDEVRFQTLLMDKIKKKLWHLPSINPPYAHDYTEVLIFMHMYS